jgi:hypothetical protein
MKHDCRGDGTLTWHSTATRSQDTVVTLVVQSRRQRCAHFMMRRTLRQGGVTGSEPAGSRRSRARAPAPRRRSSGCRRRRAARPGTGTGSTALQHERALQGRHGHVRHPSQHACLISMSADTAGAARAPLPCGGWCRHADLPMPGGYWIVQDSPSGPWLYTVSWPSVPSAAPDTSGLPAMTQASLARYLRPCAWVHLKSWLVEPEHMVDCESTRACGGCQQEATPCWRIVARVDDDVVLPHQVQGVAWREAVSVHLDLQQVRLDLFILKA